MDEQNLFMKNNPLMPDNNIMEKQLDEKATSTAQQQAAGIAHAVEKGELPKSKLFGASKQMFDSMSSKELDKFASTKHKGLPKHVDENSDNHEQYSEAKLNAQRALIAYRQVCPNFEDFYDEIESILYNIRHDRTLNEKWDKDVDIKHTGENEDKTIAQLKKEKQSAHGKSEMGKLNFAIRAKQGWPKGEIKETEPKTTMEENIDTQTPTTTAKAEQNPVTAQGNVVVQEMPEGDSVFATKPMWKNMMEAMNVPSTPETTEECSTPKKKKYRFTEEQVKMIKEIQVLKESMNKLENGKKLLF